MDCIVDPFGNTGKSFFARAYAYETIISSILMKIDNLYRMKLNFIKKIENYRMKHHKDPKLIFSDFTRA